MLRLRFRFWDDVQLDRTLDRFSGSKVDARPAWDAITASFLEIERQQFATQGGFSGGWAPLSPAYAAWKAIHYPGKPILRRTDDLFISLTQGPEIHVSEPRVLILGSAVEYGRYHMRTRPPIDLPEFVRRGWVKIVQRFIVTGKVQV